MAEVLFGPMLGLILALGAALAWQTLKCRYWERIAKDRLEEAGKWFRVSDKSDRNYWDLVDYLRKAPGLLPPQRKKE